MLPKYRRPDVLGPIIGVLFCLLELKGCMAGCVMFADNRRPDGCSYVIPCVALYQPLVVRIYLLSLLAQR